MLVVNPFRRRPAASQVAPGIDTIRVAQATEEIKPVRHVCSLIFRRRRRRRPFIFLLTTTIENVPRRFHINSYIYTRVGLRKS